MYELEHHHVGELFVRKGAVVLVDGQYGSTGKGALASKLAFMYNIKVSTSNAGPNSGHTFYHNGEKHVLMQLPTFAVKQHLMGLNSIAYLNAGAIIDPDRLIEEAEKYPGLSIFVSPFAALAAPDLEGHLKLSIGSTGKGTGAGSAQKIMRHPKSVFRHYYENHDLPGNVSCMSLSLDVHNFVIEVSQGYSLGIDAGFYPYCTSRNCTVAQAMSDAGLHPDHFAGSIMTVRTYPIRVGGNSGPCYPDQEEITWDLIGVEPETTTVTGKQRRIFTWSAMQYEAALRANRPEVIFLNFANYLKDEGEINGFISDNLNEPYKRLFGRHPLAILIGMGPTDDDIYVWDGVPF